MYIKQTFKKSTPTITRNIDNFLLLFLGIFIIITALTLFQIPWLSVFFYELGADALLDTDIENMSYNDMMAVIKSQNLNLFLILLSFVGMILGAIIASYIEGVSFLKLTTSRRKIDFKRIFFSFFLCGSIGVAMTVVGILISPENYVLNFDLSSFLVLFLICIIMIPIQASAEEYVFRGYLMQSLGRLTKTRWFPFIFTSIAFGLMHLGNPEVEVIGNIIFVYYIGSGFLAGIMTLMDEGMELALGWHISTNFFIALLVTADWTALNTPSVFKDISSPENYTLFDTLLMIIIPIFIIGPIIITVFAFVYKWKNWRQKLFGVYDKSRLIIPNDINPPPPDVGFIPVDNVDLISKN